MKRCFKVLLFGLFILLISNTTIFADNNLTVFRIYNPQSLEHLYTVNEVEKDTLTSSGWNDEGIGWVSAATGDPVFRLYNSSTGQHLFTSDQHEVSVLTSGAGWIADFNGEPLFYSSGNIPVYRLYNPGILQHHLTTDANEYKVLGQNGWNQEGVTFYALSLEPVTDPDTPTTPTQPTEPDNNDKTLIAYFSATNTTQKVATVINNNIESDLFEIEPQDPYSSEDLNYSSSTSRCQREQNDRSIRPAIKNTLTNLDQYSVVFLGYPIWFNQEPRIIDTFLESYNFNDKTIIPFCTSGSSSISYSESIIKSLVPAARWIEGKRLSPNNTQEIIEWIASLKDILKQPEQENNYSFDLSSGENGKAPMIDLNNGDKMPVFGLGTYSLTGQTCVDSVYTAIKNGYRLIDTAYMYGNEKEVGEGVKKAINEGIIKREDIFVITKLYPNQYSTAKESIDQALDKLDLGYIDMMMLHHPVNNDVEAYKAMEESVKEGKVHSLGLSNYYIKEIDEFLPKVNIKPTLVQNEIHPYYQERDVVRHIQDLDIRMQGWYPLGGRGHQKELLSDPVLEEIAKNHNKSVAQVILRWDLQNGVIIIPGSSNPDHIKENISIFDFELTPEEMSKIDQLNRNEKHDWY